MRTLSRIAFVAVLTMAASPAIADEASPTLADLASGKLKIVDLAWPLNDASAYWPGPGYEPFRLRTIATFEANGVSSKAFSSPEHLGTHLDAPNHFAKGQISVDKIDPHDLFAEGVVIDAVGATAADSDYRLRVADLERWESEHGRIPERAVVFMNTGWARHWQNSARYQNRDVRGQMHFPGYSAEAAKWLVEQRNIRGIGIDTMSIDFAMSKDFAVHHIVNGSGRYGIENLAQLDKLPPRGFYVVVAPMKIETGTGGPTRVFAILE